MPRLIVTQGPTQGREYQLEELCLFGRSPSCQIYIGDLTVSRQHARLVRTDEGYVLEDLGSGNGTWVNEAKITRHVLQDQDEIRISESRFRFLEEGKPTEQKWVNMVTVLAGNEPGLISRQQTQAQLRAFDTAVDLTEKDLRVDLARAHRMLETLYTVTGATSSILETKRLLNTILESLLAVFPDAELGYIMLLDEKNQLVPGAIRRQRGSDRPLGGLVISQSVVSQVMHEGMAVLSGAHAPDRRITLGPWGTSASKMCAPLSAQGKVHGILHIEGKEGGRPFSHEDLDLLAGIGRIAAVAIVNASMHQRLMRQQRLEQDLRFAQQVQQSFFPLEPPEVPGYRFSRRYNPVYEVGGDFYDFIPLPDNRIGVTIGDVSGKGVSAALMMARLTSDIRYFAISEIQPAQVLARANTSLFHTVQDNMFATVLYLVLDPEGTMTVSNAGHIPPIVRRGLERSVVPMDEATNLALGVLPDTVFEQSTVELAVGDSVLLATDGLLEAKNAISEEYGFERVMSAVAQAAPDRVLDDLLRDLLRFTAATAQYDDLTLVAFTRVP